MRAGIDRSRVHVAVVVACALLQAGCSAPQCARPRSAPGSTIAQPLSVHRAGTNRPVCLTERALDVAIDGEGFFSVLLPDGSAGYTRYGAFQIDADHKLVTTSGNVLTPVITLPSDLLALLIDSQGRVSGRTAGSPDSSTDFGQIQIHGFVNPGSMSAVVSNVLRPTDASGPPVTGTPGHIGLGLLRQGFLEELSVNDGIAQLEHDAFGRY